MSQERDTQTVFMEATYRALCTHGYADLTMQDIADETDKSKAALHYHFDGKDDLFREFLAYLHEGFAEKIADHPDGSPVTKLVALVRRVLDPVDDESDQQFNTAFMEIKAQAPYRDGYREILRRFDADLRTEIADLVREAIDAGQYDEETAPEEVAEHVLTYIHGTWTRAAAIGADVVTMREHLIDDLLDMLVEDATVPVSAEPPDAPALAASGGDISDEDADDGTVAGDAGIEGAEDDADSGYDGDDGDEVTLE
ncbi:TetR/AcrR family transcriptional regulator [Halobaculum roseum]|uniref:TetR/AcrR family transcriptional regulator n=1 Tax=Halobaculum roseum TaxID=2175149 RepID=A0ABD5MIS0_9EURY|nr:TetR/AcrR family transcriptional regulator [Halobaculum roseum]QZY03003.1 TetR/AcrR family transcriptional regulator [Halobaculum roseum]